VYFQNMTLGVEKIDNGTKRPDKEITTSVEFNDSLRVVIPFRTEDESVPRFIKDFSFNMESKTLKPGKRKKEKKMTALAIAKSGHVTVYRMKDF